MKKVLKVLGTILMVVLICGGIGYLTYKNMKLNKAYESAAQQITELQSKLNAVGTMTDVLTVRAPVKMGQVIKDEDITTQTVPTSSVPNNAVLSKENIIGSYYRIGFQPHTVITSDLISTEEYVGAVYDRDVFMDSLPVGITVGDYIDIRVVLPGGDEMIAFEHRRVQARYENAIKLRFTEQDLWLYTSMMVDRALYKDYGLKVYATKYVDPGAHEDVRHYYPVRSEVVDMMNISPNLTDAQKRDMWNKDLRGAIDKKLDHYSNKDNEESKIISGAWREEEGRFQAATSYYESLLEAVANGNSSPEVLNGGTGSSEPVNGSGLVDPNTTESVGEIKDTVDDIKQTADGVQDTMGNASIVKKDDVNAALDDNIFEDESPIN